ncbi:M23 family metallopeptidase [Candidatus Shapirobacteria bacterium]|nr:M23 family metallopeptidase [Candidatus Shapirobacteria bacterium]
MGELKSYLLAWYSFFCRHFFLTLGYLQQTKGNITQMLYQKRGKMVRPMSHFSVGILVIAGIALSPLLVPKEEDFSQEGAVLGIGGANFQVLGASEIGENQRGGVVEYTVVEGDTVSSIAQKFDVSLDTIRWANDLKSIDDIKPGQVLRILPVSGVLHTVRRGETVYSLAKTYGVSAQVIVDFPFNTFADDETFSLAVGQELIVPGGSMPKIKPWEPVAPQTPSGLAQMPLAEMGSLGDFIWPTTGSISQGYSWYHKAIDIANGGAPVVVAAKGGTVTQAGWGTPQAYGIHVMIDHQDGTKTLYGHLSSVAVAVGQSVMRGQVIGQMGSTGRSTGIHLHFEIRTSSGNVNPLNYLR